MIFRFVSMEKIRLDEFLRSELPSKIENPENSSNSKIRRLIAAGAVSVNGKQVNRPAFELRGRSVVSVNFDEKKFFHEKQPNDIKFELSEKDVLFEDEYLICVNKPSKFPTEETIVGGEKRDNLHDAVVRYLWKKNPSLRNPPYVGIMHRLDRETSGVILFTKSRTVNKDIQNMFESHDFKKFYIAVCSPSNAESKFISKIPVFTKGMKFTVEMYMNRISPKSQAAKWGFVPESKGGLYSKTDFEVMQDSLVTPINGRKSLKIQADLYTGRTHQIRVHLASKGIPILGDDLYGGISAQRIMLHAERLIFTHPVTGENLEVKAECPF